MDITIVNDTGGFLHWYVAGVHQYVSQGANFKIDGLCASACTYVLSAIDHVCVTPNAVFKFHQTSEGPDGPSTLFLWNSYPEALQHILHRLTENVQIVKWPEVLKFAKACD